jgi:hypothetical protein
MFNTKTLLITAALALSGSPCIAGEVAQCNAEGATDPIIHAFYDSRDKIIGFVVRKNEPQALRQSKLAALDKWNEKITMVRQEQYDDVNNIRWCMATVVNYMPVTQELLSDFMFYGMIGGGIAADKACGGDVKYKIEQDLDTGDNIVTWWCQHTTPTPPTIIPD